MADQPHSPSSPHAPSAAPKPVTDFTPEMLPSTHPFPNGRGRVAGVDMIEANAAPSSFSDHAGRLGRQLAEMLDPYGTGGSLASLHAAATGATPLQLAESHDLSGPGNLPNNARGKSPARQA